ncbi:Nop domain-containing protein [Testicularia cyperi]|uniref:Nop domain-containing protein n=1 Tax=Testicularia cyperi TaxID=1882483 RepID=A0A317XWK3_9BASI|nr:Nop domain-containing protein [Testicularia cyperi]
MASLADELLADLGSDDEHDFEQHDQNGTGQPDARTEHAGNGNGNGLKRSHPDDAGLDRSELGSDNKRRHLDDADLDDLESGSSGDENEHPQNYGLRSTDGSASLKLGRNAVQPAAERVQADVDELDLTTTGSVRSVATLLTSGGKIPALMKQIEHYMSLPEPDLAGVLEDSPEYHLIVRANNLAVDVDNEVMVVHKFIRDHYSPRFPELESLIPNPWDYVQAVKAIGNEAEISSAKLDGILPHGTVVVISMTAATTEAQPLPDSEWRSVQQALDMVFELEAIRSRILEYVESRMSFIAPNLSAVVGTRTATKLLGVAGGLEGLSKIPACNVHLLGTARKNAIGLSSAHSGAGRSTGFLSQSELVRDTPEDYQRQAIRMVSAKAILAARMDAGKTTSRDGSYGLKLRDELSKKLEKLQEPPPQKLQKVLPVPKEGGDGKKRRGGRRARKAKERNGMTELRKMQNRVEFGKEEEEAFGYDESVGLGMINSSSSGKIRAQVAEERSKGKMSKANKNRLAALRGASSSLLGGGSTTSLSAADGTASSLSFTPVQGIELVDPSRRNQASQDANAKWFKEGQFSLLPGAKSATNLTNFPGSMGPPPPRPPPA